MAADESTGSLAPKPEDGDYAELVNEDDERGPVRLCRQDGTVVAIMSSAAYDYFCARGAGDTERAT
jgi:hypothetical protein